VGLFQGRETVETAERRGTVELDLVTHDLKKFCGLMLRRNGYVLEQLYSPLAVHTTAAHEELKAIGKNCITRLHAHHYLGFADSQWRLFDRERPRMVKPLLYVYRVLLTGINLMQTGEIEANLIALNERFRLASVPDLIQRKTAGVEKAVLPDSDLDFHSRQYLHLRRELEQAAERSTLPRDPSAKAALHDLVVRLRLSGSDCKPKSAGPEDPAHL
jgi:hypothetical protein